MKKSYFGWFNWKSPDEIDSKAVTAEDADISLHLKIKIEDYAQLVKKFGRKGLKVTFQEMDGV